MNSTAASTPLRQQIKDTLSASRPAVETLAKYLHAHPELAFEEHGSAREITEVLARHGFTVETGVGGLETAFDARIGTGELGVGICVEYDALPNIGHACGHNIIAGSSVAAALALAPHVDALGITLRAIGTPAEEHGGGKAIMLERGVFDGVGLSLMLHPMQDGLTYNPTGTSAQAVGRFRATFKGKSAHAAAAPHLAINAADAAVLSHVAIGLLRQQIQGTERVALFTKEAGSVTNIIPDRSVVEFEVRAFELDAYNALQARVVHCFEGAAIATGTTLEIEPTEPLYEPLKQDDHLSAAWVEAMNELGLDTTPSTTMGGGGSTDMGNISQVIPSLHPWFSLPGANAPIHSEGFVGYADTPEAYEAMFTGALGLAWTVATAATDSEQRAHYLGSVYRGSQA